MHMCELNSFTFPQNQLETCLSNAYYRPCNSASIHWPLALHHYSMYTMPITWKSVPCTFMQHLVPSCHCNFHYIYWTVLSTMNYWAICGIRFTTDPTDMYMSPAIIAIPTGQYEFCLADYVFEDNLLKCWFYRVAWDCMVATLQLS